MRTLVLEAGNRLPRKHQSVLLNLFDMGQVTVEDVLTPRGAIEAVDLNSSWPTVLRQLTTSHHSRVVAYEDDLNNIRGILHLRRCAGQIGNPEWTLEDLRDTLQTPYFVPAGTPVLIQLQYFQENRQRMGVVVDEYGEVLGLVTPEDIVEEIVGEFTASAAMPHHALGWAGETSILVDGSRSLRELNRNLGTQFSLDGPKTLNGLIIDHFQDIPESGVSFKVADIAIEVVQTQGKSVRTARLFKLKPG
jgi:Mg2+/Co2+ transporter CorB